MQAPQMRESPLAGGQFADENTEGKSIIGAGLDYGKRLATLKAQLALRGHQLHEVNRAGQVLYVVSRWGQSRTFSQLNDVDAFLRQIGGAA